VRGRISVAAWLLVPAVAAAAPRRAGVVDARPLDAPAASRTAVEEALRTRPDLRVVSDPALLGIVDVAKVPPAVEGCAGATDDALLAWLRLAPLPDVREPVARLLGRQLMCADGAGDRGAALAAARRLSALGSDGGVGADVWSRYPAVDATVDVLRQPLTVATDPSDAAVRVDFTPVAGDTAVVSAGQRLVTASAGERVAARFVDVKENRAAQVALALPLVDERWAPVRAAVRALRGGGDDVAAVARTAGLDVVVVLRNDTAHVYTRDGDAARPAGSARIGDNAALLALLAPGEAPPGKPEGRSYWIYAVAAGAAAAAVGLVVLAGQSGSSTQRIEVKYP